ncbi:MAG: FAD-dependent oxidoreductase, partial [Fidelibacterota bacterium]
TIHGMENVKIVKYGYAIEYDFFPPHQLRSSLETKLIDFLFLAGQINGTSGYEEAAAQGIIAGINAVKKLGGEDPLVLKRSEAYIGVLIDDLITKSTREPYRMFTSRAEYRLILRADNADLRLMDYGRDIGLIAHDVHRRMEQKRKLIEDTMRVFSERNLEPERVNPILESKGSSPIDYPSFVKKILKRPEISIEDLRDILLNKRDNRISELFQNREALEQVELEIKYEGYINRQREQIDRFKKFENFLIPEFLDYNEIKTLSRESREKLSEYRPESLGQASRISGVSPSDITVILITLRRMGLS